MPTTRQTMSSEAIEELIAQRVANALLSYEENQNNGNGNGNGSHNVGSGSRRTVHTTRGCTYKEFMNCQPHNFKGTEGAVGLARWFEKMESVFHISNCAIECHVKQAENKRRLENNPRDDHVQQPSYKRRNVTKAYIVRPSKKREYAGTLPLCNKCKFHHTGPCIAKCRNCKKVGHLTKDCRSPAAATN
ncbi:reverse transcriptase domain-containing protein [Tanacetum coccineum]